MNVHPVIGPCETPDEVAARANLSYAGVIRMLTAGQLIAVKESGRWLVSSTSVDDYIARELGETEVWLSRALVAGMSDEDVFRIGRETNVTLPRHLLDTTREQLAKIRSQPNTIYPEAPAFRGVVLPYDGLLSTSTRGIDSATSTTGGPFKFGKPGAFINLLRSRLALSMAGASVISGLTGPVSFPKETGSATATWRAENPGSDLSPTDFATTSVTLSFKTIQSAMNVSRQALFSAAAGNYDLEQIIRGDLASVIALAVDLAGLTGLGASNQPLGILTDTAVATATLGANGGPLTGTFVSQVVSDVFDNKGDSEAPTARWLTNGQVERYSRNAQRAANINLPLLTDDNRLVGKPAVFSQQVPKNLTKGTSTTVCSAAIFGIWEHFLIGLFGEGVDAVVDPYSQKLQGMVSISLSVYCDMLNRQTGAFKKVVDVTTP